jgi:hypothetical protein
MGIRWADKQPFSDTKSCVFRLPAALFRESTGTP